MQWSTESLLQYSIVPKNTITKVIRTNTPLLKAKDDSFNESQNDDVIEEGNDELSDWRAFRSKLAATTSGKSRPKSVSKKNEALLKEQNEILAKEYTSGVWAHSTAEAEVGGLLCRMPLEAEVYRSGILQQQAENTSTESWYSAAQDLIQSTLESVPPPPLDPSTLPEKTRKMFSLYISAMQSWQEVALVFSKTSKHSNIMVLNRPMALKLNEDLAALILFGSNTNRDISQMGELVRFLVTFENECYVYVGGPDNHTQPALCLHGISTLPGAKEISPGSGVYTGPLSSAVDAVMSKQYKAVDFRFVFGVYEKFNHQLDNDIQMGRYQPIACARSLALKQCISLPKPLWHEIMELCGGEYSEDRKSVV